MSNQPPSPPRGRAAQLNHNLSVYGNRQSLQSQRLSWLDHIDFGDLPDFSELTSTHSEGAPSARSSLYRSTTIESNENSGLAASEIQRRSSQRHSRRLSGTGSIRPSTARKTSSIRSGRSSLYRHSIAPSENGRATSWLQTEPDESDNEGDESLGIQQGAGEGSASSHSEQDFAELRTESPEYGANFFSKLVFHWISPLLWKGFKSPLSLNDIPKMNPDRGTQILSERVKKTFKELSDPSSQKSTDFALWWSLYQNFKTEFWIGGVCRVFAEVLLVATPYTLRYLIQFAMDSFAAQYTDQPEPPISHGFALLVGICAMLALQTFCHNHYMFLMGVIGGQTRAVLTTAIFEKSGKVMGRARPLMGPSASATPRSQSGLSSMRASEDGLNGHQMNEKDFKKQEKDNKKMEKRKAKESKRMKEEEITNGYITGLLTVECARIDKATSALHIIYTAPIAIVMATSLLIVNLGVSALAGLGLLFLGFIGLVFAVGTLFRQRKNIDAVRQARVAQTHESLAAIRIIKYFGWTEGLAAKIIALRSEEVQKMHGFLSIRNLVAAVTQALPSLTGMISFITYALTHEELSAAIVFSSVALFTSLRGPLIYLPACVQGALDSWFALLKIQRFLLAEEMADHPLDPTMKSAVEFRDASFVWERKTSDATSEPASPVEDGDTIVKLPTGHREEAREHFVLKDVNLTIKRGELVGIIGSVGAGKTALLSALTGDMATIAGSVVRGEDHAIAPQQPWMQNSTVRENITFGKPFVPEWYSTVLSTCQLTRDLELLRNGDQTVVGERGIVLSGGQKQRINIARAMYSQKPLILLDDPLSAVDAKVGRAIMEKAICSAMAKRTRILCTHDVKLLHRCDRIIWMEHGHIRSVGSYANLMRQNPDFRDVVQEAMGNKEQPGMEGDKVMGLPTEGDDEPDEAPPLPVEKKEDKVEELIQSEDQAERSVSWSVYGSLVSGSKGFILVLFCFPLLMLAQGSTVLTSLWLAWWTSNKFDITQEYYIAIYGTLGGCQIMFLYLFGLLLGLACIRSSKKMLNKAVMRVLKAPISFFDTTPLGRHTNRFSADVETIDYNLTESLRMFLLSIFGLAAIFALIIAYYHWFAIAVGALVIILGSLAFYYRASAREIKRHESVLRSMVFARFVEGMDGSPTLRSYNQHAEFSIKLCNDIDNMQSASYMTYAVQRWLGLRQDMFSMLMVVAAGILVIVDRNESNPATAGLVLSLMLGAVQVIQVVVREWADVENSMNSTERLHSYATTLPQEVDRDDSHPDDGWPPSGQLDFSNVRMRYRPGLPESLKGISMTIQPGEHVAIVGRTGAGKSSIVNALFRLTDLSGGRISIDGKDITSISLKDLRHSLSIIPQETTLFSGTVRSNLDPFDELTDEQLWAALKTSGLHEVMNLDDVVADEGVNMSVGQRQLLALARVLVRDTRVLVCDEATASLDTETDDRIQGTMRSAFRDRTVICIAHRLRTVLWYDRVCVMDAGQVAEFGPPLELFRQDGIFRDMCERLHIDEQQIQRSARHHLALNTDIKIHVSNPTPQSGKSSDDTIAELPTPQDPLPVYRSTRDARMSLQ